VPSRQGNVRKSNSRNIIRRKTLSQGFHHIREL
jgi:hypothetical protein